MTNLSARVRNATWEKVDESLLQDVISVLDTVYKASTRSEAFSRALPYTVSVKERSSSANSSPVFLASSSVLPPKSALQIPDSSLPSRILSPPSVIPPPGILPSPISVQPTDAPSSEHRSQLRKATKSSVALSEAYVANTISLEQDQLNDIHNFLGKINDHEVNFWNPNLQVRVTTEEADLLRQPVNYGIFLCSVLHDAQVHHKILQRFARLAVYNLTVQGYSAEDLANAFRGSTLLTNVGATLQKQIEGYIQAGNRYSVIAQELGGLGSIFFLPPKVGHSLWEQRLPKKGPEHRKVLQRLVAIGVPEVSKPFHQLATDLLNPSRTTINAFPSNNMLKQTTVHTLNPTPIYIALKRPWSEQYQGDSVKVRKLSAPEAQTALPSVDAGHNEQTEVDVPVTESPVSLTDHSGDCANCTVHDRVNVNAYTSGIHPGNWHHSTMTSHTNTKAEPNEPVVVHNLNPRTDMESSRRVGSFVAQKSSESIYKGTAEVARLDNLENILGHLLLELIEASPVRQSEKRRGDTGPIRVTSALTLYIVSRKDKDFILDISLNLSAGREISKRLDAADVMQYLRDLLGGYLFTGLMASNHRLEEEKKGMLTGTSATEVIFLARASGDAGCKLRLALDYNTGCKIWYDAF